MSDSDFEERQQPPRRPVITPFHVRDVDVAEIPRMAQVTLGDKSFDEDAEEIHAPSSRFSDADCAALGAAMAAGNFKRLKKLWLVSLCFCYVCGVCFPACLLL